MRKIGYARVSSTAQNLDRQMGALRAERCDEIFREKASGKDVRVDLNSRKPSTRWEPATSWCSQNGIFCSAVGWEPYAWRTVAGRFRRLPGVRRRQVDRRTGDDRTGYMPVVYKIPKS